MYDDGNLLPWNTKTIENFNLIEKLLIFIRYKLPFFHLNTIHCIIIMLMTSGTRHSSMWFSNLASLECHHMTMIMEICYHGNHNRTPQKSINMINFSFQWGKWQLLHLNTMVKQNCLELYIVCCIILILPYSFFPLSVMWCQTWNLMIKRATYVESLDFIY